MEGLLQCGAGLVLFHALMTLVGVIEWFVKSAEQQKEANDVHGNDVVR